MLTQEQANELNLQQHALEAAQIGYAKAQAELDRYDATLNEIKNNFNSYSPEKQAQVSSLLDSVANKYQELKNQRERYSLAQYEAQQQIDYYNQLAAQPPKQTRRQIKTPIIIEDQTTGGSSSASNIPVPTIFQELTNAQRVVPVAVTTQPYATISAAGSRYPTPQTAAEREGTWGSRWNVYPSGLSTHIGYYTPDYTPAEIQRVRNLHGSDYAQGMKDLRKYRGYDTFNQNAYKNGYKWDLH